MSRANRNFVIAYVLLVGLPLVGLAAILKSGRRLVPPISIDGTWNVEADTTHLSSTPCAHALSSLSTNSLLISQSGKTLVLTFNDGSKTTGRGVLDGKNVRAPFVFEPSSSGCMAVQRLLLDATVDIYSEPRSLKGSLLVNNCPDCTPIEFHAVRLPQAKKGGAH